MFYGTTLFDAPTRSRACERCGIEPERLYDIHKGAWAGATFCADCAAVCNITVHKTPPRTHCKAGHDLKEHGHVTPDGRQRCKECWREQYARKASAVTPAASHCKRGHALNDDNTYYTPKGHAYCIICERDRKRESARRRYHARKAEKAAAGVTA